MGSIIVGLDIGTSYIRAVIGELSQDSQNVEIIGVSRRPSQGLRNGVIVNLDATAAVIREVIEEAELSAGIEVESVYTAIGGAQIECINTSGLVAVDQKGNRSVEISETVREKVIEAARAIKTPEDKMKLTLIPQDYIIDGIPGYKNPIGNSGVRLELKALMITASVTALKNIDQCITRAGYLVPGVMLKTLAASYATVHQEEMDQGSILIDLGGGTTDVMVFNGGAPVFVSSIPAGGNLVTNDIAIVKKISNATAEKIKLDYGCCWVTGNETTEEVIIPGLGGRAPEQITRYDLCQIIQPRLEEIFTMVRADIAHKSNLKELGGNIILTGGGSLMPGIVELAQYVWNTENVRLGEVSDLGGADQSYRSPDYATVVGLVMANKDEVPLVRRHKSKIEKNSSPKEGLWKRFKESFF